MTAFEDITTRALLLHWDEELTNQRPGRPFGPHAYSSADRAFLLQFYSMFYDDVLVPANFIVDLNTMPEILKILGVSEITSTLRAEKGSLGILLDTSRFPSSSFVEMVQFLNKSSDPYITMRNPDIALHTAKLVDKFLTNRIFQVDMTAHLDHQESVAQLQNDVFNSANNWALAPHEIDSLAECLEKIVARGEKTGYGRTFYYSVWGYGRTPSEQILGQKFIDIVAKYRSLKHKFLLGVDYISHRLKASFAGNTLGNIEILMPFEYLNAVKRPDKALTLGSGYKYGEQYQLRIDEKYSRLISREAVINMTAKQLLVLHNSTEYRDFKLAWHVFRENLPHTEENVNFKALEAALNAYLDRISATLNPKRQYLQKALSIFGVVIPTSVGLSVTILMIPSTESVKDIFEAIPVVGASSKVAIEIFSRYVKNPLLERRTAGENPIPFHSTQLADDVKLYLSS